jgi:hypothetical protein
MFGNHIFQVEKKAKNSLKGNNSGHQWFVGQLCET